MTRRSYEIKRTQYDDPDQQSGQHTNGPANIFVREDDASPWYLVERIHSERKVRDLIEQLGICEFQRRCVQIGS